MALWVSIHLPQLYTADSAAQSIMGTSEGSKVPTELKTAMFSYTPRLALPGPACLLLDIKPSLKLFGGPYRLCHLIQATLKQVCPQYETVMGLAPTALGAWVLAYQPDQRQRRYLRLSSLMRGLHNVSVHYLPASRPHTEWLHSLGAITLGKLLSLPRAGLVQRTSTELGHQLNMLTGTASMPVHWHSEPDTLCARMVFDTPVSTQAQILHSVQPLLQQLAHWLQLRQQATSGFVLQLHHDSRDQEIPVSNLRIRLSVPAWKVTDFQPLLAETLHHHALPAKVLALALTQLQTLARPAQSTSLFPDSHLVQRQERQLLDLLTARLGSQHILQPCVHASHLPEQASQWAVYQDTETKLSHGLPMPALQRPFWMFDPVQCLQSYQDRPVYQDKTLQVIEGPERIETGWWLDGQVRQRDYYIARDRHNRLYWIYHQRGSEQAVWFLQGLFA